MLTRQKMLGRKKEEKKRNGNGLLDMVFSWSFVDVLNKKLCKDKVTKIPVTFSSIDEYMKSFINPLLEETHSDLLSSLQMVRRAPTHDTYSIEIAKGHKPPKNLLYKITFRKSKDTRNGTYKPQVGDLIALTNTRPKRMDDMNRPQWPYLVASVEKCFNSDAFLVLSSKPNMLNVDKKNRKMRNTLAVVYLTNMITNVRIWNALNLVTSRESENVIKSILHTSDPDGTGCCNYFNEVNKTGSSKVAENVISSFDLDYSQHVSVLSCLTARECNHRNTVKLIWGPPGTGKTKTVASLLFALLNRKCRTLTCAPTNVAVMGVVKRLLGLVKDPIVYDTLGLGDIVLFGNEKRMKINDHVDLLEVFLDNRVSILSRCLNPKTGWNNTVETMISLLENPEGMYFSYLTMIKQHINHDDDVF